ncbi:uncharacterized protein AAEQ78_014458 isoform 2-T5 [Lycaon pictus]
MLHVDWGKGVLQIQTGLAWSWRTCLSRMLSGGPDVAGPWTTQCSKSQVDNVKYMTTPPKGHDPSVDHEINLTSFSLHLKHKAKRCIVLSPPIHQRQFSMTFQR